MPTILTHIILATTIVDIEKKLYIDAHEYVYERLLNVRSGNMEIQKHETTHVAGNISADIRNQLIENNHIPKENDMPKNI